MNYDTLIHWIAQFGYAALFFALWLGIVGMPIPDEVVVMTGGAVGKAGVLHSTPAFIVTYLGVISGLSLGYILGRFFGSRVLDKLRRKKNMEKHIQMSERLINKYGNFALSFSYFIPVVRHIVPYLVGINKMSFRRYILYSYTAGLVWTSVFFVIGQFAGSHVETMGTMLYHYGLYAGLALLIVIFIFLILKSRKRSKA
ncbi:DedA family protein [Paenibacillus sp. OAS669]|uniref:DedA family protein n=1 Tax=Paenibacillus sp. OAS669 TaxID=2663821 RepID=UPI001789F436|nr:DedA family protein [Paenibacillus sp. OAS669]MBE1446630.1 membrane protein DedA with SNARE-associated domain [Paenibacillus sp. OAS669]